MSVSIKLCYCGAAKWCSTVPATIINTLGGILHRLIIKILISGQVQSWVFEGRVPGEQLCNEGDAQSLVSLGPAGNWFQNRDSLSSGPSPCSPGFTDREPMFKLLTSKSSLTELGQQNYPSIS